MQSRNSLKLPMNKIVEEAFQLMANHSAMFLKRLFITGSIIMGLELLSHNKELMADEVVRYVYLSVFIIVHVWFAITIHRLVLLGPKSVPGYGILSWKGREWRYLGWIVIVALYLKLLTFIFYQTVDWFAPQDDLGVGSIGLILMGLVIFPGLYFFSRLVLIFPAVAVEKQLTLRQTYKMSKKNGWRLLSFIFLFPTLYGFILAELYHSSLILDLFLSFLGVWLTFFILVILSISFRYLYDIEDNSLRDKDFVYCRKLG